MGMDAIATIWLGVRAATYEDMEPVKDAMEALTDKLDEIDDDLDAEDIRIGDLDLTKIYCCDELEGVGVILFRHDWDNGAVAFNPADLQTKIDKYQVQVEDWFYDMGIPAEYVGVWIQTNYW